VGTRRNRGGETYVSACKKEREKGGMKEVFPRDKSRGAKGVRDREGPDSFYSEIGFLRGKGGVLLLES